MQIDWFTFFAQIVNFLIVLFLLKRFLYAPILRTMKEREAKIAGRFEEADARMRHVQEEGDTLRSQRQELESRRQELLSEATNEAAERRRAMVMEARQEVKDMQDRWYAAIEHEKLLFLQDLRTRLSEQLFQIARRALADLSHVDLETAIIDVFIERLRTLAADDSPERGPYAESATETVIVRTTFELPPPVRQHVMESLQDILIRPSPSHDPPGDHLHVHFTQSPDLICGIEVQVRSRRIGWNLRDYLDGFEEELENAFSTDGTQEERHTQLDEANLSAAGILLA